MKRNLSVTALLLLLSCALFGQVNTALLPPIRSCFIDGTGDPLSLGKVFSYSSGTTTPLSTYTDATGISANTNPTILGVDGCAVIWLGNAKYKIIIQNSLGVQIGNVADGVSGNNLLSLTTVSLAESTAPAGNIGSDILWADSASHRFKMNNNNTGADFVIGANTTDTFTNKSSISENLTTPNITSPNITGTYSIFPTFFASANQNNVLHVGGSVPGSGDIGVRVNATYGLLPSAGGEIVLEPQASGACYDYSTPIVFSTPNKLVMFRSVGGACLNYTPTTGNAITVDYSTGNPLSSNHGFYDLLLQNNGCITSQGCGGSAVGIAVGNVNSGHSAASMINVAVRGFAVGYQNTNALSSNVQWFNPQFSANITALSFGPQTGVIMNGGTIAGNSTAIKLAVAGSIELDIFATQFFSNTNSTAGVIDATAVVGTPGEVNCHDCHMENQPSAGSHMIAGNIDIHLFGGLLEDDNAVGTADWFISASGNTLDIHGTQLICARTMTQAFLLNAPARAFIVAYNASSGHFTNIVGGADSGKATVMTYSGTGAALVPPWTLEPPISYLENTAPSAVAGQDICYGDGTAHAVKCSYNNGSFFNQTQTIGTGTSTSNGTAIASGVSQAQPAITITGAAVTDVATCSLNAAPVATWQTGIQLLPAVVTANTVTPWLSNPSAGSITPVAAVIRCTVIR